MASGSQNNTSYQAQKWTNLRAFTIGATGKDVDGSANVSWSMDEIMGSSDSTKFYRGDKTWSNTLTNRLILQENNNWLSPAQLQLLRPDTTAYTDRACIGVTDGNLHIDPYPNKGLYLNFYNSGGNIYFNGSTYYINGGNYNGNASTATWLYPHICNANGGTAGYFHFATLVINGGYVNKVIKLNYVGRGRTGGMILIWVNNSSSADPELNVNYAGGPPIYFKKRTTSTWDLYVQKEENYGNDLFIIANPGALADGGITLTWQNAHVASVPSGYSTAAVYTPVLNISGSSTSCSGNAATATTATDANYLISNTRMDYGWNGINYFNLSAARSATVKNNQTPYASATWTHILRFNHANNAGYYTDLAIPFNGNSVWYRRISGGTLQNAAYDSNTGWVELLDAINYTGYTVTKTGSGASGTWGINVTGYSKSVLDSGNNSSNTTFAYSKAGLNYGDYTWLAGWNGYELRAVNKSQFAQASHSHGEKLNQWFAGTAGNNAVTVTHASTGSDNSRGQCFAFGNGNGTPWFVEILYGYTYVTSIRLSNGHGSTRFISATQFCIISTSWDEVTVCQSPSSVGAISGVTTTGSNQSASGNNYRAWIEGNSVTGAVWNDYAENREVINAMPGQCVYEVGDDTLKPTENRLSHFAGIISDTWGFSQGETEAAKTPIAVAGRVLAYTYRSRDEYKPGDVLCAAPGGTVDIMTREEIQMYPDKIVGTVSCVPDYETWGGGEMADREPVEIDGRIWVKVK